MTEQEELAFILAADWICHSSVFGPIDGNKYYKGVSYHQWDSVDIEEFDNIATANIYIEDLKLCIPKGAPFVEQYKNNALTKIFLSEKYRKIKRNAS